MLSAQQREGWNFHRWRTRFEESVTQALHIWDLQALGDVQECLYIILVYVEMGGVHIVQYLANATHILDHQVKNVILLTW